MKTLKFDHEPASQVLQGVKTSTWRLYDDKDLSVDDQIRVIDKVDSKDSKTWQIIGTGTINEVIEKKLADITDQDMQGHEAFSSKEEMLATYKRYYGDRVTLDTTVKIVFFKFIPSKNQVPTGGMLLDEAKVYTDGGSRGNPGDSSCAYVICKMDNTVVEKSGFYLGMATNNQAEYLGFKHGLERARDLGIDKVYLHSDSQLVVNQMKGLYKIKNQELAALYQEVKSLADSFEKIEFNYVPREMNKIADGEVNRILDEHEDAKRAKR